MWIITLLFCISISITLELYLRRRRRRFSSFLFFFLCSSLVCCAEFLTPSNQSMNFYFWKKKKYVNDRRAWALNTSTSHGHEKYFFCRIYFRHRWLFIHWIQLYTPFNSTWWWYCFTFALHCAQVNLHFQWPLIWKAFFNVHSVCTVQCARSAQCNALGTQLHMVCWYGGMAHSIPLVLGHSAIFLNWYLFCAILFKFFKR